MSTAASMAVSYGLCVRSGPQCKATQGNVRQCKAVQGNAGSGTLRRGLIATESTVDHRVRMGGLGQQRAARSAEDCSAATRSRRHSGRGRGHPGRSVSVTLEDERRQSTSSREESSRRASQVRSYLFVYSRVFFGRLPFSPLPSYV